MSVKESFFKLGMYLSEAYVKRYLSNVFPIYRKDNPSFIIFLLKNIRTYLLIVGLSVEPLERREQVNPLKSVI